MEYENFNTIINVTVLFPAKYKYTPMFTFLVQKIYKQSGIYSYTTLIIMI